jgi:quercetin dioxygenase-like cupin family protein
MGSARAVIMDQSVHIVRKDELPFIGSSYNFVGADHENASISMFLVEAQPGRGAPLHFHEYDEIVIVQEGKSRLVIGDSIHEAIAGDIIVIKAGTPHGFINIGESVLKQTDIHVNPFFKQQNLAPTKVSRKAELPV